MSTADQEFIKSLSVSYASVAKLLGVSRQAISRGVQKVDKNYFNATNLSRIISAYESRDPIRSRIARRSISTLYPEMANEILQLLDSRHDVTFDVAVSGDYTLVTADFVHLMGKMKPCSEQIASVLRNLEFQPGTFTVIVGPQDYERAYRFRDGIDWLNNADQRIDVRECEIDLTGLTTYLMLIGDDYSVNIFVAKNKGFEALDSSEADRIKSWINKI